MAAAPQHPRRRWIPPHAVRIGMDLIITTADGMLTGATAAAGAASGAVLGAVSGAFSGAVSGARSALLTPNAQRARRGSPND